LDIDVLCEEPERMDPLFSERIVFIIRHAANLCTLDYKAIDDEPYTKYNIQLLQTCVTTLNSCKIKPNLYITYRRSIVKKSLCNLLMNINDTFSVMKLNVWSEEDDNFLLGIISRFHNLRVLEISNLIRSDDNYYDMNQFLGHLPLQELILHEKQQVASFPQQITALTINDIPLLTNSIWAAACNLKHLSTLEINCYDTEERQNGESLIFQSSNLQTLSGSLRAKTKEILTHQIIQPILDSCNNLTSIELAISSHLSTTFLVNANYYRKVESFLKEFDVYA
jgi:hypothetical protein